MDADEPTAPSTAVWYFVAATFLFSGAVFGQTLLDTTPWLGALSFAIGALVMIIGCVVFARELRAKKR